MRAIFVHLRNWSGDLGLPGGEGEIRTHGTREGTTVFETVPIDHSGTSPREARYSIRNTKGKLAGRVPEESDRPRQNWAGRRAGLAGGMVPDLAKRPSQPVGRSAYLRSERPASRSRRGYLGGVPVRLASEAQIYATALCMVITGRNEQRAQPRITQLAGWAAGIPSAASAGTSAADAER